MSDAFSGKVAPEWRPKGSWLSKAAIAFATIDVRKMLTESTATFAELRDETPESFFQQSRLTRKERDDELLAKLHGEERAAWQRYRGALSAARVNLMSRLQLGSLIAFGDREWHRSDPEWIPVPAWEHLDFDTQQKDAICGRGISFWNVRVIDLALGEPIVFLRHIHGVFCDSDLISQCGELLRLLRAGAVGPQGEIAAWQGLAAQIIRTPAATPESLIAKYEVFQTASGNPTTPERAKLAEALRPFIQNDLDRAGKDWKWLSDSLQRQKHKRVWNRWERNRENDHKWLALTTLTDFWARKRYGDHTLEGARTEAWRHLRNSILNGEFSIGDKSRVLLVCPGDTCWRLTPKFLQERPLFPEKGQPDPTGEVEYLIDGYLKRCWVPNDLAVQWLQTYHITLPDNLLPSFPRGAVPVDRLGETPPPATPSPPPRYLFIDQAVKQIRTRLPDLTARRASDRLLQAFRDGEFETHKKADNHLNTSRGRTG